MSSKEFEKELKSMKRKYPNPLSRGGVQNYICPCGSGRKVKRCHGIIAFVSKEDSLMLRALCDKCSKEEFELLSIKNAQGLIKSESNL